MVRLQMVPLAGVWGSALRWPGWLAGLVSRLLSSGGHWMSSSGGCWGYGGVSEGWSAVRLKQEASWPGPRGTQERCWPGVILRTQPSPQTAVSLREECRWLWEGGPWWAACCSAQDAPNKELSSARAERPRCGLRGGPGCPPGPKTPLCAAQCPPGPRDPPVGCAVSLRAERPRCGRCTVPFLMLPAPHRRGLAWVCISSQQCFKRRV